MKNKTIRKIAFGLAATSIVSLTSACSKKSQPSIPQTAITTSDESSNVYANQPTVFIGDTIEYKGNTFVVAHNPESEYVENEYSKVSYDNGINTDCLFFVRIDGKIYLATRVIDKNANNIISKYYAIDTGDFLGQTLDINWYARATTKIESIMPPGTETTREYTVPVNSALLDQNYFNGEYGLGKNLFSGAIIKASSIFSNQQLSKEQIELLLSDPLLVASYVEKIPYSTMLPFLKEDYFYIPLSAKSGFGIITIGYLVGFRGEISYYYNAMQIFSIEDGEGKKEIVGYRASTVSSDKGYNYIYDVSSSRFVDISQCKILDIKDISGTRTVGNLREQFDNPYITTYSLEDLKVISTTNLDGDDVFEKYYIAKRDEYFMDSTYRYNVLGENEFVALSGNYDGSRLCIAKDEFIKNTPLGYFNGRMISLEECLTKNGLSQFVKESYTAEELTMLLTKLRSKELDFGETSNQSKSVNLSDIIVVDTTKESGEEVLVNGDKKYYVLIPYEITSSIKDENTDTQYYETCNHDAMAAISFDRGYVRIDNIAQTFYHVDKTNNPLNCISSLESVLKDFGLDDLVRDQYSLVDLQILADLINEKGKALILNK